QTLILRQLHPLRATALHATPEKETWLSTSHRACCWRLLRTPAVPARISRRRTTPGRSRIAARRVFEEARASPAKAPPRLDRNVDDREARPRASQADRRSCAGSAP